MVTRRRQILELFIARLAMITIANGFATNAGQRVSLNAIPEFGKDDPDTAIAVLIDDDRPEAAGNKLLIDLPLNVLGLAKVKADLNKSWIESEDVLGDIKRAVEIDFNLGGLLRDYMTRGSTSTMPREMASAAVGVMLPYLLPYSEAWGNPGGVHA